MKEELLRKIFTKLFIISAIITAVFSTWSILYPINLGDTLSRFQVFFSLMYGWFIKILPIIIIGISLYFGISKKYRDMRFGGPDARPEFSTFSWLAMLFTAGIGIGIVYFGINEGAIAYLLAPDGIGADGGLAANGTQKWEAAKNAMAISIYHWGVPAWAIFSISGLSVGYFTFRHGTRYLPGAPIEFAFKGRPWAKPVARVMNVLGVVCSALTISATMGIGAVQIASGARIVANAPAEGTEMWPFIVLAILFVIFTLAAVTPLKKGMKFIGDANMWMAIGIMVFVMIFGPTRFIFEQIFDTFGSVLTGLIPKNFEMYIFVDDPSYTVAWDTATLLWWIAWTPFMCVFIASISKGRKIKEFCFATMTIPVIFMVLWLATFSGTVLLDIIQGSGEIGKYALENPEETFFALLRNLPFSGFTQIFTLVLIIFFLATTCTSAAISLSRMTGPDGIEISHTRSAVWSVLMTLIAVAAIYATISSGGIEGMYGIRALATALALPYLFFYILIIAAFIKQIRKDEHKN